MWRAGTGISGSCSDLEELVLLALEQGVDGVDVFLGEALELLLAAHAVVLPDLAVLDQPVEVGLCLAADVADRDARFLGLVVRELDVPRRLSSVRMGRTTRMMLPSLLGFTPRSESRSVFSISCIEDLSNGLMMMVRASGVWNDASCWSRVGAP